MENTFKGDNFLKKKTTLQYAVLKVKINYNMTALFR